jgi:hypothetical protein
MEVANKKAVGKRGLSCAEVDSEITEMRQRSSRRV